MILPSGGTGLRQPFDALAKDYDRAFTDTAIGGLLRRRTRERMAVLFPAGSEILEINCGTGEDAAFLAGRGIRVTATDASPAMIDMARNKIGRLGLGERVRLLRCGFDELDTALDPGALYDGILSNFGGLNCASDLPSLAQALIRRLRPRGCLLLCVMGRFVPWEWLLLGCRGKLARIGCRIRGACTWRGQAIRYHTPGRVSAYFAPGCEPVRVSGLGFLLPPTGAASLVERNPRLFRLLDAMERRIETIPGVPQLSDHFVLELVRQ